VVPVRQAVEGGISVSSRAGGRLWVWVGRRADRSPLRAPGEKPKSRREVKGLKKNELEENASRRRSALCGGGIQVSISGGSSGVPHGPEIERRAGRIENRLPGFCDPA
jgi:hypothetical protein